MVDLSFHFLKREDFIKPVFASVLAGRMVDGSNHFNICSSAASSAAEINRKLIQLICNYEGLERHSEPAPVSLV